MDDGAATLIHDWNEVGRSGRAISPEVRFMDETLRDGLQNASVVDPPVALKIELLHRMEALGIHVVNIGLPGAGRRAFEDSVRLAQEIARCGLRIRPACAGRTVTADITPIVEISQRAGIAVEVYAFIGSSPIRQYVEGWDVESIAARSAEALDVAVRAGLPATYVTEDTTRSRPETLDRLFRVAIEHGASRLCLADTVGHATPDGVRNLVHFTRALIADMGVDVGIDWHGHNDRGLALENALWAAEYGATRIHGTALGIGERVGNTPMELLLLNLKLLGVIEAQDLTQMLEYCRAAARAVAFEIPINYPLVGRDAFRTATGVHAAALLKALARGDEWLADRVYSGVPAGMFGLHQQIVVGYMSGASNVMCWLRAHGIEPTPDRVHAVLDRAKSTDHILRDDEILQVLADVQPHVPAAR